MGPRPEVQLYPGGTTVYMCIQLYTGGYSCTIYMYLAELIPDPTREYLYEGITDMDPACSTRIKVKFHPLYSYVGIHVTYR